LLFIYLVGYDSRESLGNKETGAVTALPIWLTFMHAAIAGKDDEEFPGDEGKVGDVPLSRAAAGAPGGGARITTASAANKSPSPAGRTALVVKPALALTRQTVKPAKNLRVKPALASGRP